MKHFNKLSIYTLALASILYSCEEAETTTIDVTGTAIIKGIVLADIEQVNTQFVSEPISGVNVRILWDSEDLGVISDGDGRTVSITALTDENGAYSVEVPTTEQGISFTIEFDEFETSDFTYNNGLTDVTTSAIFPEASYSISTRTGETKTRDHDYGSFPTAELEEFATITGVVEVDSEQIDTEDIPEFASGSTVTVEWEDGDGNERSLSTTTNGSGEYSLQVPTEDVSSNYTVTFEDFTVAVSYNDGFRDVTGFSAVFEEDSYTIGGLDKGEERARNHNYGTNPKDPLPTFGKIEGLVLARRNNIPGEEDLDPVDGLRIRITWEDNEGNTRGIFVTTNTQGEYSVEVPLAEDDDFSIRFPEFTFSNYSYNNGTEDVTGATATYGEINTPASNIAKGEERTVDRTFFTPSSVED